MKDARQSVYVGLCSIPDPSFVAGLDMPALVQLAFGE